MTSRERLLDRRRSQTFAFRCEGDNMDYTGTVSYFDDGRVAELFIANHKSGSHVDHSAKDSAILASLALQYGAPLDVLRGALLRDHLGRAITPVGAALDLLANGEGAT